MRKSKKNVEYIDLPDITVPTKWEDLTLYQLQEIERYFTENDRQFNVKEIIHILTNKSIDEINDLPIQFIETILVHLAFLQTKPDVNKDTTSVLINGEVYSINPQKKMRTGEFIAADAALKNDKFDYCTLMAILLRKENEKYDSRFENEVLEDRIEMFKNVPAIDILPVINFFLHYYLMSESSTVFFSKVETELEESLRSIERSQKGGVLSKLSMKYQIVKLKKLLKHMKSI